MTSTAKSRSGPFGIGSGSSNHSSQRGFASGFGNGNGAWNEGIWSGKPIGSGMKSSAQDSGRVPNDLRKVSGNAESITGSGSLLPSSESDGLNLRHGTWRSIDETSPSLSRVSTKTSVTSPLHRQNSSQLMPPSFNESSAADSTYFPVNPGSTNITSRSSQKNFLGSVSGNFVSHTFDPNKLNRTSRQNSDEEDRFAARKLAFDGNSTGLGPQSARQSFNNTNASGYNSSVASRSGSVPRSRGDVDPSSRYLSESQVSQCSRHNTSTAQRPNLSAQAPSYTMPTRPSGQNYGDQLSPSQMNRLLGDFGNLNVGRDNTRPPEAGYNGATYSTTSQAFVPNDNGAFHKEVNSHHIQQDQFSSTASGAASLRSQSNTRRGNGYGALYPASPSISDARPSHTSPYYSTAATPPTFQQGTPSRVDITNPYITGQTALLDHKLRGLQQEQQAYTLSRTTPMQFSHQLPHPSAYDFHPQPGMRMNPLSAYYQMPPIPQHMSHHIPRGPASDHATIQPVRSALLEEFRNNSKTNKRYELKDIYNYIVEFSGDQHGSRFIQQKLETANSDEKEQVFRELYPNAIQLMTDVFGNYVIQKFFEHGNQSQKKTLANQMRTHILSLSNQMYGCRVVQKALEHILTDQQAQLVRELEHNVLKCVKDQNGNHVVQKAIERVPAEHISFILNAFTGQVQGLATHPYGCRVIQRMLEHCEEPTQTAILQEIHANASSLILDQFGNYVAQHIIEHGKEEDRTKLIDLVISQLANFSKHKFASNVVEKSIQHGSPEERDRIVATLTVINENGESPSQSLIRDQYGNYVIQKVLNELKGSERDSFVELIKAQLALLKRFSYGKQIAAIEKLIYTTPFPPQQLTHTGLLPPTVDTSAAPTPPLLTDAAQSPQSSSVPSTQASSIGGPDDSRKLSGTNDIGLFTPTST